MSDLDALLEGIVADPHHTLRWLVMADWLEENGQPERAELVRVHRELLRTCTKPDAHADRPQLHARMMELMRGGAKPTIPERTRTLPGDVTLTFSFIPPGEFLMGSPANEANRDRWETLHRVTLSSGFWLAQTPVTQRQWVAVMRENPSHFRGDELPVEMVSWDDAQAFCAALKSQTGTDVRLPTEAEWEYAARAGTTTPFYWGTVLNGTQANCDGSRPYGTNKSGPYLATTTPVGSYARVSPHPWALVDMTGNIWEWCADLYRENHAQSAELGVREGETGRVFRGGNWICRGLSCRSASRLMISPESRSKHYGFRLAADLSALA